VTEVAAVTGLIRACRSRHIATAEKQLRPLLWLYWGTKTEVSTRHRRRSTDTDVAAPDGIRIRPEVNAVDSLREYSRPGKTVAVLREKTKRTEFPSHY
jgi:hypothetical protein